MLKNSIKKIWIITAIIFLMVSVNALIIYPTTTTSSTTDGWNITGSKYLINLSNILDVNETVINQSIDERLISIYYNASELGVVRGTTSGLLTRTMHLDGAYDGLSFNLTEEAGAVGLDIRFNFTGIEDFNKGILRYRTTSISGDYPIIQLWNYDTSAWEDYPQVVLSESFVVVEQSVFDSSDHLTDEIVQIRLYKLANGNTGNTYYIDWLAISKGVGTPAGNEVDPVYSLESGNIFGNLTFLLENASNQDDRIIILEAGGGGGTVSPQWDTINGVITSNISIEDGRVNVTGNLTVYMSSPDYNTSLIFGMSQKDVSGTEEFPTIFNRGRTGNLLYRSVNSAPQFVVMGKEGQSSVLKICSENNFTKCGALWMRSYADGSPPTGRQGLTFQATNDNDKQFNPFDNNAYNLGNDNLEWKEVWAVDTSINHASLWMRDDENEKLYHLGIDEIEGLIYETIDYQDLIDDGIYEYHQIEEINKTHIYYKPTWLLKENKDLKSIGEYIKSHPEKIKKTSILDIMEESKALKELLIEKNILNESEIINKKSELKSLRPTYSSSDKEIINIKL